MKNVFNEMTNFSVNRPKTTLCIIVVFLFALTPNAMFINFDSSEDAFFPDNDTVRLLNDIEDDYQASIDFVRFIDDIDSGDLYQTSTWEQLAILEAILIENPDLDQYKYPLFGIQANNGMASSAIQWHNLQDAFTAADWISEMNSAILNVANANNSTLQLHLDTLHTASTSIPSPGVVSAEHLRSWEPSDPSMWLERLDSGDNLSQSLVAMLGQLNSLNQGPNASEIAEVTGPITGKLGLLNGLQSIDYRSIMISNLPAEDSENPWDSDGPV